MTDYFTAVVTVDKVAEEVPAQYDQYDHLKVAAKPRVVGEVAKIVVRADTIEKLVTKVTSHVNLIEIDE